MFQRCRGNVPNCEVSKWQISGSNPKMSSYVYSWQPLRYTTLGTSCTPSYCSAYVESVFPSAGRWNKYQLSGWVINLIITNGDGGCGCQQSNSQPNFNLSGLVWGWWPPGGASAFVKWIRWILVMAIQLCHEDRTINIVIIIIIIIIIYHR